MIGHGNVFHKYYWVIKKKRIVLMGCVICIETKVQKPVAGSPFRLCSVNKCLIFLVLGYGKGLLSPIWRPEF